MPIKIPDDLPARRILDDEGVPVIHEQDAVRQGIRPMRIAVLNLMPEKIKTETQIARLIGATPLQVELTLVTTSSYVPTTTSAEHMLAFYVPWSSIASETFDGMIVTGAPVEEIDFEAVDYWTELTQIFDWARTNVHSTYNICWGGQAALYHYYGIPKHAVGHKLFGVFEHHITTPNSSLLRGFADRFLVPVSRHTGTHQEDLDRHENLVVLAASDETGIYIIEDRALNQVHVFNHLEYDAETLHNEYQRDLAAGRDIRMPVNYYPDDDASRRPPNTWRAHGHLLFANWINAMYQTTPFKIEAIGE